jgi:hypothetical protein
VRLGSPFAGTEEAHRAGVSSWGASARYRRRRSMAIQSVEARFEGEKLASYIDSVSVNTLYYTP